MLKARELDSAELNSKVKDLAGDGYCGVREKSQSRVKLKRTAITFLLICGKAGGRSRQKVARYQALSFATTRRVGGRGSKKGDGGE